MIIAVDGPTASGKGTIARALGKHFSLPHLDTGLLYRAVGQQVLFMGGDPDNPDDALKATLFPDSLLTDPNLRSEICGGLASKVSRHPEVRKALFQRQRDFATQPGGAVLDGRDIGTVIAPDAPVKLFIEASVSARAKRRYLEMLTNGQDVSLDTITEDLMARDERDRSRVIAPLRPARGAITIDTSNLDRDSAIKTAIELVEQILKQSANPEN